MKELKDVLLVLPLFMRAVATDSCIAAVIVEGLDEFSVDRSTAAARAEQPRVAELVRRQEAKLLRTSCRHMYRLTVGMLSLLIRWSNWLQLCSLARSLRSMRSSPLSSIHRLT